MNKETNKQQRYVDGLHKKIRLADAKYNMECHRDVETEWDVDFWDRQWAWMMRMLTVSKNVARTQANLKQ